MNLTEQQIKDMKPCRRSNWIVYMEIMGNKAWKFRKRESGTYYTHVRFSPEIPTWPKDAVFTEIPHEEIVEGKMIVSDVPDYFGSISAAWEVVEKAGISEISKSYRSGGVWFWGANIKGNWEYGKTPMSAICRSALIACARKGDNP